MSFVLSDATANANANPTTRKTPSTIHGTCRCRVDRPEGRIAGSECARVLCSATRLVVVAVTSPPCFVTSSVPGRGGVDRLRLGDAKGARGRCCERGQRAELAVPLPRHGPRNDCRNAERAVGFAGTAPSIGV